MSHMKDDDKLCRLMVNEYGQHILVTPDGVPLPMQISTKLVWEVNEKRPYAIVKLFVDIQPHTL